MTTQVGLEFKNITKRYGPVVAVQDVNLAVGRGELLTLLGPSGSGKTTLLKLLAGFEVPDAGEIVLNDRSIATLPPAARNVGMVFQNYALFPHLSVLDNVGYGLRYRGQSKAERHARAKKMLSLVRLEGYDDRYPRQLSGGQQQRVAIARALAIEPDVLLMDEPLGALDRQLRLEMEQEIRRLHHELDTTFIYVTHDQEEALTLSDRVAIMRNGRLTALGAPRDLYEQPPSAFVARFFSNSNLLPVDSIVTNGNGIRICSLGGEFELPGKLPDGKVALVANPSAIQIGDSRPGTLSFKARVKDAVFLGELVQLQCQPCINDKLGLLTVRSSLAAAAKAKVDDFLELAIPFEKLRLVDDN
ncbi:MAG: ABC transporter ATP-binding protein [Rhodospirillaceae bacterium]|nr:MAG: ABC transporter ATP-binding protein [Rhodospirillaceae bacterium]